MSHTTKRWTIVSIAVLTIGLLIGGSWGVAQMMGGPQSRNLDNCGYGMMGPGTGMGGMGMMGPGMGDSGFRFGNTTPLSLDQAADTVTSFLNAAGASDLALAEVMEFVNGFYAQVVERSTEIGAFELIIDRYTGAVYPEMGPNMMWNTKYGMMGMGMGMGMMGSVGDQGLSQVAPTTEMSVTPEAARDAAQRFLDFYLPGTTVDEHVDPFYGYYTIHVLQDESVIGMLSVNGYTGQVWYHTWHGSFIGAEEFD
ncbi:MAG: hypothetical protein ACE5JP_16530 [Candidatus Bipolaricaulia bacterium]